MLAAVASSYSEDEVAFLAINRNDPRQTALQFLDRFQIGDSLTLVHDPSDHFFTALSGDAMPETIVFDRDGDIVARSNGPQTQAALKDAIERALANK
jgi:hypothetical protein